MVDCFSALNRARGVVLRGPRQSGKSTLARKFLGRESANYFDLEYPPHGQRLEHATQTLEQLRGLVVIDEVQLRPGLFRLLRTLMDRSDRPGQYLLLGSAWPELMRQAGESLLGRVETVDVGGFRPSGNLRQRGEVSAKPLHACGCAAASRAPTSRQWTG